MDVELPIRIPLPSALRGVPHDFDDGGDDDDDDDGNYGRDDDDGILWS